MKDLNDEAAARARAWERAMIRETLGRRAFLRGAFGGAAALALGGASGTLLSGCGGGGDGQLGDDAKPIPATTRMIVSTFLNETVEQFRAQDDSPLPTLLSSQGSGITMAGVVPAAGGKNLFVFSPGGDRIFLCDAVTGALKRVITGIYTPHNGAIGPDGNLYAVNAPSLNYNFGVGPDTIEKIDPETGDRLGTFCEVRAPFSIAWGPDGDLYIGSTFAYLPFPPDTDYVSRFNGQTGEFKGYFVKDIKVPFNITFHPDGDMLIIEHFAGVRNGADFVGRVNIHDKVTGKVKDSFADADFPIAVTYGPDGHLYVSSFTDNEGYTKIIGNDTDGAKGRGRILKFDGKNGRSLGTVIHGMSFAGFVAFI